MVTKGGLLLSLETSLALFSKIDGRVRLLEPSVHKNGAFARNRGVEASSGELLAFLDDDDWWEPEEIARQVEAFASLSDEWGVVSCRVKRYRGDELISVLPKHPDGHVYKDIMLIVSDFATGTLMVRRSLFEEVGRFDEDLVRHQDLQLLIELTYRKKLMQLDEPLHCCDVSDGPEQAWARRPCRGEEGLVRVGRQCVRRPEIFGEARRGCGTEGRGRAHEGKERRDAKGRRRHPRAARRSRGLRKNRREGAAKGSRQPRGPKGWRCLVMASETTMATTHTKAHARPDERLSVFEQRIVDWFPAVALFIFVAYHGLRDTVASMVGMYGLVVYALTGAAWFLLAVYWLRGGLKLAKRFILLPAAVFAVFAFYMAVRHIDGFVFEEYALPQAINPMGGMVAFVFLASQNDASRADTALKLATVVMTVFLQSSLGSVMQATTVAGYDMGLGFDALFFALLSLHFIVDCKGARNLPMTAVWTVCAVSNVTLILSYGSPRPSARPHCVRGTEVPRVRLRVEGLAFEEVPRVGARRRRRCDPGILPQRPFHCTQPSAQFDGDNLKDLGKVPVCRHRKRQRTLGDLGRSRPADHGSRTGPSRTRRSSDRGTTATISYSRFSMTSGYPWASCCSGARVLPGQGFPQLRHIAVVPALPDFVRVLHRAPGAFRHVLDRDILLGVFLP